MRNEAFIAHAMTANTTAFRFLFQMAMLESDNECLTQEMPIGQTGVAYTRSTIKSEAPAMAK
jgi:hypothetical protein